MRNIVPFVCLLLAELLVPAAPLWALAGAPKIAELKRALADIQPKINALDAALKARSEANKPSVIQSAFNAVGNVVNDALSGLNGALRANEPPVLSLDDGSGSNRSFFGRTPSIAPIAQTLTIHYSGGRPAQFKELRGLEPPFAYKSGSFPGEGGTCAETISTDCHIVLVFSPSERADAQPLSSGSLIYTFQRSVKISFADGGQEKESAPFALQGFGDFTPVELVPRPFQNPIKAFVGARVLGAVNFEPNPPGNFSLKNVRIEGVQAPFSLADNGTSAPPCAGTVPAGPGGCRLTVSYAPMTTGIHKDRVTIHFAAGAGAEKSVTYELTGEASGYDAAANLLVVYNDRSPDSMALKNYYLSRRPGIAAANVAAVTFPPAGCTSSCPEPDAEVAPDEMFISAVRDPLIAWFKSHPSKDIRAIVLLKGIPTRLTSASKSAEVALFDALHGAGFAPLLTYINMDGSLPGLDATKAYIDKLATAYRAMAHRDTAISGQDAGIGGETYYLEDAGAIYPTASPGQYILDKLLQATPHPSVVYRGHTDSYLTHIADVRGLMTWGLNGGRGKTYMSDRQSGIVMSGKSGWYIINTFESYNGQLSVFQGNFLDWWGGGAFGNDNYRSTPVGAVTTVEEPSAGGKNTPDLFSCWEAGQPFIACAWESRHSPVMMAVGDPWVSK